MHGKRSAFEERYGTLNGGASVKDDEGHALEEALQTTAQRKELLRVAQSLHSEENIHFCAKYYEIQAAQDAEERKAIATALIEEFLLPGSPHEINLQHTTRLAFERVHAILERGLECPLDHVVFRRAYEEVVSMLLSNVWAKYKEEKGKKKNKKFLVV